MSDWVHCNKCCIKYGGQTSFFLVECGHIFCQRCVETIRTTRKCVLCNKSGNILPLNKDLEQSVLDFFLPMENIFRKGSEIYRFQLQQRTLLYQKLMDKYNYAKKEYMNCSTNNKHLQKENQMLRSMLRAGKNSQRFVTSTPVSQPSLSEGNVTFQNASLLSSIPAATRTPSAKMYPGYSKRSHLLSSGSSHGPSPAQRVPFGRQMEMPMVHRNPSMPTMRSLEELRRSGKSQ